MEFPPIKRHRNINAKRYARALSIMQRDNYNKYEKAARSLTKKQPLHLLHNYQLISIDMYSIDHIVSVWDGYVHKIPLEQICHLSNLRVITVSQNSKKGNKSPLDRLIHMLNVKHVNNLNLSPYALSVF